MTFSALIRNKPLFWLGTVHLIVFLLLALYCPFNETIVLGINSAIKPMKFALSIWAYAWTMGLILNHLDDVCKVVKYSWAAVIAMSFEQLAITSQAFRGELSHFNKADMYCIVLFSLMGLFILTITLWTGYMAYLFIKQKTFSLPPATVLGIKIGLIYFVVFSLFGGYISGLQGHTVGAADGGAGLSFLNWSKTYGDLRVAHFFGIHSLQIIPLFAILFGQFSTESRVKKAVWLFSIAYLFYVVFTMVQGLMGMSFLSEN